MKRWLSLLTMLTTVGGIVVHQTSRAQVPADLGPGEQGATLKRSALPTSNVPTAPPGLQSNWNPLVAPDWRTPAGRIALPPTNHADINRDIEVVAEAGSWLILVTSYSGEQAPVKVRTFVAVLRLKYKLNSYVFNYGAEEKRKEYERVEAERARLRELVLKETGRLPDFPIRVRVAKIEEQTGVLVGGYRTRDEALNDLKRIRKLPPPDPKEVDLAIQYVGEGLPDEKTKYPCTTIKVAEAHHAWANPFATAFPVRNPRLPAEQVTADNSEELAFLRKVNKGEPLSLLQCKKPYTLLIKEYRTAQMLNENSNDTVGFVNRFVKSRGEWDYAFQNAHNVAEGFRKLGLPETYVLHGRYCSYVTVGGFDSLEDPNLLRMQNFLEQHLRTEGLRPLDLLSRPIPMEVPR